MSALKRNLILLISATGALALLAGTQALAAAPFVPPVTYHIASAQVTRKWDYRYAGRSNGLPFASHGGESTRLTMSTANESTDAFGIYTANLRGSFHGSYYFDAAGTHISCASYHLNPAAVGEQLQLNLIALAGNRVEVNAGVGPGQTAAGVSAMQKELEAVGTACGRLPGNVGYGLTYSPAPNNVHTPECSGIADGCEILSASAFRSPTVTVHIVGNNVPIVGGHTVILPGATGHDRFSWSITVVLKRAA